MKLASVGIDPDRTEFAAEYVSTEPLKLPCVRPFYYVILEEKCPFKKKAGNETGGATRLHLPGTGIEPIAPVLTDPRCELRYPLGHWRYCYTDYFIT